LSVDVLEIVMGDVVEFALRQVAPSSVEYS
jgi:hypothetical protein